MLTSAAPDAAELAVIQSFVLSLLNSGENKNHVGKRKSSATRHFQLNIFASCIYVFVVIEPKKSNKILSLNLQLRL